MNELPKSIKLWKKAISDRGLQDTSIYNYTGPLSSASKIADDQFLLLRVVWLPIQDVQKLFNTKVRNKYINAEKYFEVKRLLDNQDEFKTYLGNIGKGATRPFSQTWWSRALHDQLEVIQNCEDNDTSFASKVIFSPPALRPRAQAPIKPETGTPTPIRREPHSPSKISSFARRLAEASKETVIVPDIPPYSSSSVSALSSPPSPLAFSLPLADSYDPHLDESTNDEMVVNQALISLLLAITNQQISCNMADWSIDRCPFIVRDKEGKVFEARLDGCLRTLKSPKTIKVVVEVKRVSRQSAAKSIQMQEGAQMAAWIAEHPPSDGELFPQSIETQHSSSTRGAKRQKIAQSSSKTLNRLLISQDKDELFIIIGTFDAAYARYIGMKDGDCEGWLTMNTYGPFSTTNAADIQFFCYFVLTYVVQYCEQ